MCQALYLSKTQSMTAVIPIQYTEDCGVTEEELVKSVL